MNADPNWQQSYAFYILANATLATFAAYPESELSGYYHDRHGVAFSKSIGEEACSIMIQQVSKIGRELNLKYLQELEVKHTF